MNIALDTNAYSDFVRGDPGRVQVIQNASHIYLPVIVLGELRAGFVAGNQNSSNTGILQRFINSHRVSILTVDDQTTHHYAQIFVHLRQKSIALPLNDLWIAALAVQHSLALCTSDAHFQHIPQVITC